MQTPAHLETRRRTILRRARGVLAWAAVLCGVWMLLPTQYGGHLGITVVSGHSMEPTFHTDDLLVTWQRSAYEVGDVLVYEIPAGDVGAGLSVVHRIESVQPDGSFTMLGDNNASADLWHPTADEAQGSVALMLPHGGRWLRTLFSPLALALLCGLLVMWAVAQPRTPRQPRRRTRRSGPVLARGLVPVLATAVAALGLGGGASAAGLGGLRPATLFSSTASASVPPPAAGVTYSQALTSDNPLDYCATVTVTNQSAATVDWQVVVDLTTAPFNASEITSSYGVTSVTLTASSWTVRGASYNKTLAAGASTTWGYCAKRSANSIPLVDGTVSASVTSSGNGQYCADVTVTTTSTSWVRWRATINHSTPGLTQSQYWLSAAPSSYWNATSSSFKASTGTWVLTGVDYNQIIRAGQSATWGFCAS